MRTSEKKSIKTICLQKFQPIFTTADCVVHEGQKYKWVNSDGLLCSVPEYLMISTKSNGYIKDNENIMYPLQNIISIKWELVEEKVVIDNFWHEYQVLFSNEEVEKMVEYVK